MKITRVRLFPNYNEKSLVVSKRLEEKLVDYGYQVVDDDYDLAIAIGGDGAFLRMVKGNQFDSDIYYIGVNTGTLGFLQEIKPDEIDLFLDKLQNEFYKIEEVGIQETKIVTSEGENYFNSLNEIVIRDLEFKIANLEVFIDDELLEVFTGDGLLIATSIGSTAYNISLGGSIIYSDLHTLQITPLAPLNTRAYRDLLNSVVIPENKIIKIVPEKNNADLMVLLDGENLKLTDVKLIETSVSKKKIKCLRMKDYSYTRIINDKLLK